MVEDKFEGKVKKLKEQIVSTENYDNDKRYTLTTENSKGDKITWTRDTPFIGHKAKEDIDIIMKSAQTSLKDNDAFKQDIKEKRKKK